MKRFLLAGVAVTFLIAAALAFYYLETYGEPAVDPAWAISGNNQNPKGAVTVRYTGTSTLLFSDGDTSWMIDGWFSRPGPLALAMGTIAPDLDAIERGLAKNEVDRLGNLCTARRARAGADGGTVLKHSRAEASARSSGRLVGAAKLRAAPPSAPSSVRQSHSAALASGGINLCRTA